MSNEAQLPTLEEVAQQVAAEKVERENREAGVTTEEKVETPEVPETPAENAEVVESKPEEPAKKDLLSGRFAAIDRRERAAKAREEAALKAQRDADAKLKEIQDRLAEMEARDSDKPKRPMDALKRFGWGYKDVTEDVLGGYKEPEPDPLEERFKPVNERLNEVDQLKQQLKDLSDKLQEKENRENYNTVMGNIQHVIKEGGDQYELISTMGQEGLDLVRETMVQYYQKFGEYLDYTEAANRVEQHYEDNLLKRLENSKKLRSRIAPAATESKNEPAPKPQEPQSKVTLTSDMSGGSNAKIDIDSLPRDAAIRELSRLIKYNNT